MLQSDAIYSVVKVEVKDPKFKNVGGRLSDLDDGEDKGPRRRDFEEAMVLYEAAIESARQHGFQQYEALCMLMISVCATYLITCRSRAVWAVLADSTNKSKRAVRIHLLL